MKPLFNASIRFKLTAFVGILLIATAAILIWTGFIFARDILIDQINERLTVIANDRQALLLAFIDQQQERVSLVASRTRLRQLVEAHADGELDDQTFFEESSRILVDAQTSTEDFVAILITDLNGQVITATSAEYLNQDFSADPAFIEGLNRTYLGLPQQVGDGFRAFVSAPAVANNGRPLGVVIVELELDRTEAVLRDQTSAGETGELLVATREGDQVRYLFPPRHNQDLVRVALTQVPAMSQAIAGQSGFIETTDYRDVMVLAAYRPVGYSDWGMVAKIDTAEANIPIQRLRTTMFILGGTFLLLGLAAASMLARRFTRPILRLANTAALFGAGNLDARVRPQEGSDELNQLAHAFDRMADQVQNEHRSLEKRVQERTQALRETNTALKAEIVERHRAEAALAEKAAALTRSNKELEQYAYVASHDLQEPLRMVKSYVEFLAEDYKDHLDDKGRRYIHYAADGAARMQQLIDDLLAYSRVESRKRPFELTDCNDVMNEVVANMSATIADRQAQVTWTDLPTLTADRGQLVQLFQNLVNNGIKYSEATPPIVTVSATCEHLQMGTMVKRVVNGYLASKTMVSASRPSIMTAYSACLNDSTIKRNMGELALV